MGNHNLEECFISAPLGIDIQPLREALIERGVTPTDAADALVGSYLPGTLQAAIANADFVCAVVPAGPADANVFLEIGIGIGAGRPCLLFVAPKAELPALLGGQSYARAALDDGEALRFHLDAFLKNVAKNGRKREAVRQEPPPIPNPALIASAMGRIATWEAQSAPPREPELVQLLADVFEAAGYVASTASGPAGRDGVRADLAVWVDELQAVIGNPLVVEVSAQRPTPMKARQLRNALREHQTPLGLLVSWGAAETEQFRDDVLGPMVVVMRARDVVEALARGDFARTLLSQRNTAFHSAA